MNISSAQSAWWRVSCFLISVWNRKGRRTWLKERSEYEPSKLELASRGPEVTSRTPLPLDPSSIPITVKSLMSLKGTSVHVFVPHVDWRQGLTSLFLLGLHSGTAECRGVPQVHPQEQCEHAQCCQPHQGTWTASKRWVRGLLGHSSLQLYR